MGLILDITPRNLEKVLYFASYIVLEGVPNPPESDAPRKKQILSETEYRIAREKYGKTFKVGMGAEAIQHLLIYSGILIIGL